MRTPNLFIVGAPKCGTTALHNYLHQHPDVYMAPLKELFYFSEDFPMPESVFPKTLEEYLDCFRSAGEEKIVGESTVAYLYSRTAGANIRAFEPNAKIIIMLRNPVDALQSLHNQLVFNGVETLTRFEDALAATDARKQQGKTEVGQARWLRYRDIFRYASQIERYLDLFPRDLIHVIVYDDFRAAPADAYRKTLEFLGVDPSFEATFKVINARKKVRSRKLRNLVSDPPPLVSRLAKPVLSAEARAKIAGSLSDLNRQEIAAEDMDPATRRRLAAEFEPVVEAVGRLIGRDLSHWSRADAASV
jgi:hypothetical protein